MSKYNVVKIVGEGKCYETNLAVGYLSFSCFGVVGWYLKCAMLVRWLSLILYFKVLPGYLL